MRRLDPDEHAALQGGGRPATPQIGHDSLARVSRQGKLIAAIPLAGDGDLAAPPVDVVQPQPGNLAGPQPHPRQQRQHRQVAAAGRTPAITRSQQGLHLRRLQRPGKPRPAVGDLGHCLVQRPADQALQMPEPQQRAQRRSQPLSGLRGQPPRPGDQEPRNLARGQLRHLAAGPGVTGDEWPDQIDVTTGHLDLQATLGQQVTAVPLQQYLRRVLQRGGLGLRGHAHPPQVAQQRRQRLRRQVRGIPSRAARRQIRLHGRRGQRGRAQASGRQPPAQMRGQPQLASRGQLRESKPGQLAGQPWRVRRQRARHADPMQNVHVRSPLRSSERTASRRGPLDYADTASPPATATSGNRRHIGITTVSGQGVGKVLVAVTRGWVACR